jgi:DNA ligase-4
MYGLKEKALAKAYIKLIPLQMKDPDAIRLLNWKRPAEKEVRTPFLCATFIRSPWQRTSADFPGVLYEVIGKRSSVMEGTLTIQELNDLLDELSKSDKKLSVCQLERRYHELTSVQRRPIPHSPTYL